MPNNSENNASVEGIENEGVIGRKERNNSNDVWSQFTKLNQMTAKCNICKRNLKTLFGSTNVLSSHLKFMHPTVAIPVNNAETQSAGSSNNIIPLLTNSEKAIQMTSAIARMIALDLQQFSILDDKGFQELINVAEPRFEIPPRITFSQTIIPLMYENVKKEIINQIHIDMENDNNVIAIALTTDGWTSRVVDNFLSVTLHYTTQNFEIRRYMLHLQYLPRNYTNSYIHQILMNLLTTWDLSIEKPVYFITDNGSNLIKAINKNKNWIRIPCFAHCLQLAVESTLRRLPQYNTVYTKCRNIMNFFLHSSAVRDKFTQIQASLNQNTPLLQLIQCTDVQWNSIYAMLERLIVLRPSLNMILQGDNMPQNLSHDEWHLVQSIVSSLEPIKEVKNVISGVEYPTLSQYVPLYDGLTNVFKQNNREDELITYISTNLCQAIKERFEPFIKNDTLLEAMVLDPRFKDRLLPEDKRIEIVQKLKRRMNTNTDSDDIQPIPSTSNSHNSGSQSKLQQYFKTKLGSPDVTVNYIETHGDREIRIYFSERVEPENTDIANWWKYNNMRFPLLTDIARNFLAIPATQTSSERLFPEAENIKTSTRPKLLSENVEELCFLHCNLK